MKFDTPLGIILALLALTAFSVAVSKRANLAKILDVTLKGLRDLQKTAISPVTGK